MSSGEDLHSSNHDLIIKFVADTNFLVAQKTADNAITCVGTRLICTVIGKRLTKLLALVGPYWWLSKRFGLVMLDVDMVSRPLNTSVRGFAAAARGFSLSSWLHFNALLDVC